MLFSRPMMRKALTCVVICITPASAYASAACQAGAPGCVLPIGGAPPPPAPVEAIPVVEEDRLGISALAIVGLVALAAIVAFVVLDDDEEEPVSP